MTVVASNYTRQANDLTADRAAELLEYDTETGALFWKHRQESEFPSIRVAASWNTKNAGKEAGWVGRDGYRRITLGNRSHLAHRIIWLMVYGDWPEDQVDHIDQDRLNNCLSNLRSVSNAENAKNRSLPTNNVSGVIGVSLSVESGKWRAEIKVHGRKHYLGTFNSKQDAVAARLAAAVKFKFSPNHGRAA